MALAPFGRKRESATPSRESEVSSKSAEDSWDPRNGSAPSQHPDSYAWSQTRSGVGAGIKANAMDESTKGMNIVAETTIFKK